MTIDGVRLTEGQRLSWHADDERGQRPQIRATFVQPYPFCIVAAGEPVGRAFRLHKHAALALRSLLMRDE